MSCRINSVSLSSRLKTHQEFSVLEQLIMGVAQVHMLLLHSWSVPETAVTFLISNYKLTITHESLLREMFFVMTR